MEAFGADRITVVEGDFGREPSRASELTGTLQPRIIPPGFSLQRFLAQQLMAPWVSAFQDGVHFKWVDYGSRTGYVSGSVQAAMERAARDESPHLMVEGVGFEPDVRFLESVRTNRLRRWFSSLNLRFVADESELPEQVEALLFHFSLHHDASNQAGLNDLIQSIVSRFRPRHVALADFDFSEFSDEDIQTIFRLTDSGKLEMLRWGDRLIDAHRVFNRAAYVRALAAAGYEVNSVFVPSGERTHESGAFILDAERTD